MGEAIVIVPLAGLLLLAAASLVTMRWGARASGAAGADGAGRGTGAGAPVSPGDPPAGRPVLTLVPPPPPPRPGEFDEAMRQRIRTLLAEGKKIQAVKELRDRTGLPLDEAKAAVEDIVLTGRLESLALLNPPLLAHVLELKGRDMRMEAVRALRRHTGLNLREARTAVERL